MPGSQIAVRGFVDHLGQRFGDLLLGILDILQFVKKQIIHRANVFGKNTDGNVSVGSKTELP